MGGGEWREPLAERGIDQWDLASSIGSEESQGYRVRRCRRKVTGRQRRRYSGRLGFGMLVLAVVVDLAVFELASRWFSIDSRESSDSASISRDSS